MSVIGILGTPYNIVEKSPFWWNKVTYTRQGFIDVLQELGHTVLIIPADKPENAKNLIHLVDKIVLTGGADISPQFYNEEPSPRLETTNPDRDAFEIAAIEAALAEKKAIFGVCRGIQILNVYFGGTLYQDLSDYPGTVVKHRQAPTPQEFPIHSVTVKQDSLLDFLPENYFVNSFHHQALKELAPCLTAIAHASDGIIEAVENKEKRVLAVQWHPECTWQTEKFDKQLFQFFAEKL
ncbi:gamma-glutamyl-gamma-aminobutyrate hydrolase family protein [Lactococcus nasutitermitis]|uniref:Gamma-glutamyl-gamma-aminobutyrate hydrolase family protein n=1 Tax=Lactococcus nasutitermitis TaxID=1652957 RepID=A0ABV9JCK2_9LACT|nr:gamma-glutamyl-gamma-aminobutyrate hydrolase family protein [Lactococcus nasutitermitis]